MSSKPVPSELVRFKADRVFEHRRLINLCGGLACLAAIAYALYSQLALGLEPCPLCIFQRVTLAALGLTFLLAALHHPRAWGASVYAALIALTSLATVGLAARHVYIQSLPPGSVPSCGAPLDILLRFSPFGEVVRKVLTGGAECQVVNWRFLGLSMPVWVLAFALGLGVAGVWANSRAARGRR